MGPLWESWRAFGRCQRFGGHARGGPHNKPTSSHSFTAPTSRRSLRTPVVQGPSYCPGCNGSGGASAGNSPPQECRLNAKHIPGLGARTWRIGVRQLVILRDVRVRDSDVANGGGVVRDLDKGCCDPGFLLLSSEMTLLAVFGTKDHATVASTGLDALVVAEFRSPDGHRGSPYRSPRRYAS
jgi:hypothetical protein